jgi:hypothetical protein
MRISKHGAFRWIACWKITYKFYLSLGLRASGFRLQRFNHHHRNATAFDGGAKMGEGQAYSASSGAHPNAFQNGSNFFCGAILINCHDSTKFIAVVAEMVAITDGCFSKFPIDVIDTVRPVIYGIPLSRPLIVLTKVSTGTAPCALLERNIDIRSKYI